MKNHSEAGFTLIEMMLTLFVVSLLLFMPVLSIEKITESIQIDLFFRELSSNITLMQNHAILTGEKMVIEFSPKNNLIRFSNDSVIEDTIHPLYREMHLKEGVCAFTGNGYGKVVFYGNTGNISASNAWSTHFQTSKGIYKLVFWLGSGRFEIQKIQIE